LLFFLHFYCGEFGLVLVDITGGHHFSNMAVNADCFFFLLVMAPRLTPLRSRAMLCGEKTPAAIKVK